MHENQWPHGIRFFMRIGIIAVAALLVAACASDKNPLEPSFVVIPDAATISVGQSQVFTTSEGHHADILFKINSDGGDWRQFVKATGQASDAIQLTGVKPTGDKKVYLTAQVSGDSSKISVAVLRVVQ